MLIELKILTNLHRLLRLSGTQELCLSTTDHVAHLIVSKQIFQLSIQLVVSFITDLTLRLRILIRNISLPIVIRSIVAKTHSILIQCLLESVWWC